MRGDDRCLDVRARGKNTRIRNKERKREKERIRGLRRGRIRGEASDITIWIRVICCYQRFFFSYLFSFRSCLLFYFFFHFPCRYFFSHFFLWDRRVPAVARGTYAIPKMDTDGRGKFPKEARENIACKKIYICGFANRIATRAIYL